MPIVSPSSSGGVSGAISVSKITITPADANFDDAILVNVPDVSTLGGNANIVRTHDTANNRDTVSLNATGAQVLQQGAGGIAGFNISNLDNSHVIDLHAGAHVADATLVGTAATCDLFVTAPTHLAGGIKANPLTAGALPTVAPVSGTAFQCSTTRDVFLFVLVTYTLIGGTCKVEVSPDQLTFSNLGTISPGVAGAVDPIQLWVPAAWFVKLTATNATLGTGTFY